MKNKMKTQAKIAEYLEDAKQQLAIDLDEEFAGDTAIDFYQRSHQTNDESDPLAPLTLIRANYGAMGSNDFEPVNQTE